MKNDFEVSQRSQIPKEFPDGIVDLQILKVEDLEEERNTLILYEVNLANHLAELYYEEGECPTRLQFLRYCIDHISKLIVQNRDSEYLTMVWKNLEEYYLKTYNSKKDSKYDLIINSRFCDHKDHFSIIHIDREDESISATSNFSANECDGSPTEDVLKNLVQTIATEYANSEGVRIAITQEIDEEGNPKIDLD